MRKLIKNMYFGEVYLLNPVVDDLLMNLEILPPK